MARLQSVGRPAGVVDPRPAGRAWPQREAHPTASATGPVRGCRCAAPQGVGGGPCRSAGGLTDRRAGARRSSTAGGAPRTACGTQVRQRLAASLDAWRLGIPAERAWATVDPAFEPLARSLVLAERTGASAAVVLAAAASDARSARQRHAVVAARRLGVLLVLPLGLTTLPAFVLMGAVPVVLGLAGQLLDAR